MDYIWQTSFVYMLKFILAPKCNNPTRTSRDCNRNPFSRNQTVINCCWHDTIYAAAFLPLCNNSFFQHSHQDQGKDHVLYPAMVLQIAEVAMIGRKMLLNVIEGGISSPADSETHCGTAKKLEMTLIK